MIGIALGVFSAFCLYITVASGHVMAHHIITWCATIASMIFVLRISKDDESRPLIMLRDLTLWFLYLMLCGSIIEPTVRVASSEGDLGIANTILVVLAILPWLRSHYQDRVVRFAKKSSEGHGD